MVGTRVGLVLRSKSVEVFEARRGLRGVRFSTIVSVPIPHGEGDSGLPATANDTQTQAGIAQAIRTALADTRVKANHVGVSVPAQDVLLRSFTLPLLPKAEWVSAVQFEARKYIPFKTEELVWDFHATEQRSAKQLVVTFVGIRSDTFAHIQDGLKTAGVTPSFVESQAVSLARLVEQGPKAPRDQFLGVVDVEEHAAHFIMAKDQVPYFARDIHLAVVEEAPSIPEEAPTQQPTSESPDASPMSLAAAVGQGELDDPAPDSRAAVLLSELRLSLDFFMRAHPTASVNRLVLFGSEATLRLWYPWIARHLTYPVELGRLSVTQRRGQAVSLQFACAAGLALRGLGQARVKLDFLGRSGLRASAAKPAVKMESLANIKLSPADLKALVKPAIAYAVAGFLVVAGLRAWGAQRLAAVKQQNAGIVWGFPDVGWGLKEKPQADLEALQQKVKRQLAFLRTVIQQRVSVTEKLDALAKALPEGIWLEGLNFTNRLGSESAASLAIRGACFLPDSENELGVISEFASRINEDQRFLRGFAATRLGEIASVQGPDQRYSYKTFRLECATASKGGL